MCIYPRLIDWLAISLLSVVFAGLAAYHFLRQGQVENEEKMRELAQLQLDEKRPPHLDWPQWRGPNRDGIVTETDLLASWPKTGPPLVWQKSIGEGYASFAIIKGRLFTIVQEKDKEAVLCWNATTGKEIWRFAYPSSFKNSYGNGPRATPTVDGEHVYTVGGTGIMHCLLAFSEDDAKREVWKKELLTEFAAPLPSWGVAFSPLVEGERVFIQPGGPAGNSLAALDRRTGKVLWNKHDDQPSYSSPIAATFQAKRQILFFTGERLVGVDPETGEQLWQHPWVTSYQCNIATPIIVKDYVFISSGYDRGCALLKIEKVGEVWEPSVVYEKRTMRNHFSTCVYYKDYLYGFDDGNLACINFRTGKVQWKERGFDKGSVLVANDRLVVYGEQGTLALAESNPREYEEKSRFQFSTQSGPCWAVPVIANGRLYVRDQKTIACFDVKATSP